MSQVHDTAGTLTVVRGFAAKEERAESFAPPGLSAPHAQHLTSSSLLLTRQVSQLHELVGGARCVRGLNCRGGEVEGRKEGEGGEVEGGKGGGGRSGGKDWRRGGGRGEGRWK